MNRTLAFIFVGSLASMDASAGELPTPGPIQVAVARAAAGLASTFAATDRDRDTSTEQTLPSRTALGDWDAVRQLPAGQRVVVTTASERDIKGRIAVVDGNTIRIINRGRDRTFNRTDVREVRLDHKLTLGHYAGLGLLAGVLTGIAAGNRVEICRSCDPPISPAIGYGMFGGFVGGSIGFAVGSAVSIKPGRMVYTSALP